MIPLLGPSDPFPPTDRALHEPNGLLAAGGGLSTARLLDAYSRGIFPWFSEGDPVLWWCPDPRMVLRTTDMHVSRSLRRRLRKRDYRITMDSASLTRRQRELDSHLADDGWMGPFGRTI